MPTTNVHSYSSDLLVVANLLLSILVCAPLKKFARRIPASRRSTDVITRSNYAYIKRVVDTLTEPT